MARESERARVRERTTHARTRAHTHAHRYHQASPSDGFHPKKFGGNQFLLVPSLYNVETLDEPQIQWFLTLVHVCDQLRMIIMVGAFLMLIRALMLFFYVDMLLTNSGNRRFFRAFSGVVTNECDTFHFGLFAMLFSVPLYAFKFFGFSFVTVVSLVSYSMPVLLFRSLGVTLPVKVWAARAEQGLLAEEMLDTVPPSHPQSQQKKNRWRWNPTQDPQQVPGAFHVEDTVLEARLAAGFERWMFSHAGTHEVVFSNKSEEAKWEMEDCG